MQAWLYTNNIKEHTQIGIYHDNPIITAHENCFYVAAIVPQQELILENTNLSNFEMPEALYATFELKGKYGDMLRLVQWAYHEWLPNSGYETTTNPSYSVFRKNQFLDENQEFDATYYLPIKFA